METTPLVTHLARRDLKFLAPLRLLALRLLLARILVVYYLRLLRLPRVQGKAILQGLTLPMPLIRLERLHLRLYIVHFKEGLVLRQDCQVEN
jgi:hypothetical protein